MSKAVDNEALGEMDENETRYYLYKVPFQIQSMSSETEQMSGEQYRMSGAYSEAEAEHLLIVPLVGDNAWASAARTAMRKWISLVKTGLDNGEIPSEEWVINMIDRTVIVLDEQDRVSHENSKAKRNG